jgi:hypothetical protein
VTRLNVTRNGDGRIVAMDCAHGRLDLSASCDIPDGTMIYLPDGSVAGTIAFTIKTPRVPQRTPCTHLGSPTGESVLCPSCRGSVKIKLMACAVHTDCTTAKKVADHECCVSCKDFTEAG